MTPLEDLLDQAFEALLSGDLAALAGLDARIDAAAGALPALGVEAARRLQRKAERNAKLLQAAGRGLRAARDRMADIVSGSRLTTYDAQGRKSALAGPTRALGRF
jgi:hypothetical protein